MRCSSWRLFKMPKNMGVAPRYDVWNEKYEPWEVMRRMGRLVGTGFYIPPEWYNHFRLFPPINNNFQQEKTLNPHNESEPTQDPTTQLDAARVAVREELARKSRLLASEGMRYYNIFWLRKPLDRMEKAYYDLQRQGVAHDAAMKRVLQLFYDELAVKKRVSAIQAEEAKLSGRFITMREAVVVMNVLTHLQREQLTPHRVTTLAREQAAATRYGDTVAAYITHDGSNNNNEASSGGGGGDDGSETTSADALAALLAEEMASMQGGEAADDGDESNKSSSSSGSDSSSSDGNATTTTARSGDEAADTSGTATRPRRRSGYAVQLRHREHDSVPQLIAQAHDYTDDAQWYTGASASIAAEDATTPPGDASSS